MREDDLLGVVTITTASRRRHGCSGSPPRAGTLTR